MRARLIYFIVPITVVFLPEDGVETICRHFGVTTVSRGNRTAKCFVRYPRRRGGGGVTHVARSQHCHRCWMKPVYGFNPRNVGNFFRTVKICSKMCDRWTVYTWRNVGGITGLQRWD